MNRRAFTLLEVMLSMALVTFVLAAVGTAVHLHLRVVDSGQTQVEEAQLARALLRRIADDLRSAVQKQQIDIAELMPEAGAVADVANEMQSFGTPGSGGGELGSLGDEGGDLTSGLSELTEPPPQPGLYGNMFELQVDTSRTPRIDEYAAFSADDTGSAAVGCLSDLKNVTYYVLGNIYGGASEFSEFSEASQGGGLVRREMNRATAAYAADMGQLDQFQQDLGPIAPEVAAIGFLYFDGTDVVTEWDSQERGGLPMAVEVTLYIRPRHHRKSPVVTTRAAAAMEQEELLVYRLLVHLPIAEPTTLDGGSEGSAAAEPAEDSEESPR